MGGDWGLDLNSGLLAEGGGRRDRSMRWIHVAVFVLRITLTLQLGVRRGGWVLLLVNRPSRWQVKTPY